MLILENTQGEKIAPLPNAKDVKIERDLQGNDTLSFSYPQGVDNFCKLIKNQEFVLTPDQEYVIKEVNPGVENYTDIVATVNTDDLKDRTIDGFTRENVTLSLLANNAVAGTGWTIDSDVTKLRSLSMTTSTALDILQKLADLYMCNIKYDAKNKVVIFRETLSNGVSNAYFVDKLNMQGLEVQSTSYDFCTRLIPIGKDGLKISDINAGLEYVENYQYCNQRITAYWKADQYTDKNALKEDAIQKLELLSVPAIAYKAKVLDLANLMPDSYAFLKYQLGDFIKVVDDNKQIMEVVRIVKTTDYPFEPENNEVELNSQYEQLEDLQLKFEKTSDSVDDITTPDGAGVNGDKIDAVDGDKVKDGTITGTKVANLTITNANIANATITSAKIGIAEIKTANIADANITNAKIATAAIDTANIKDACITSAKIGTAAITTAAIDDASITSAKITDAAIINAKIGVEAVGTSNIQTAAITTAKIGDAQITNAKIATAAIGTANIQDASITNAKIVTAAIDTANIKDACITSAKIGTGEIKTANIGIAQITNATIGTEAVGTSNIQDAAITTAKIGGSQITSALIASEAVGTSQIAKASIGTAQISEIEASKITSGTIDTSKVDVAGVNQRLLIRGNRLQVFAVKPDNSLYERVSLGDVNGDGSIYGFRVRGADGTTVLMDETGVKREGITEGSITDSKIAGDANIQGTKLDINSVVTAINGGTTSIQGSKVLLNGQGLDVQFTNMSTTISGKASQGDIATAIDGVQIGGRNYCRDKDILGPYTGYNFFVGNKIPIVAGQTYTISFKRDATNQKYGIRVRFRDIDGNIISLSWPNWTYNAYYEAYYNDTLEGYNKYTFISPIGSATLEIIHSIEPGETLNYIKECKLEIGNKATDWSPAPEDVQEQIDTTKTIAKSYTDSQVSVLQNAINLKVESSAFNSTVSNLSSAINSKVNTSDYSAELQILNNSINSKVSQTDINTSIANIQIGGRNYVPNSKVLTRVGTGKENEIFNPSDLTTDLSGKVVTISYDYSIGVGTTLGNDARLTVGFSDNYGWVGNSIQLNNVTTGSNKTTLTLPNRTVGNNKDIWIRLDYITGTVTISNLKVELGNKATDWTPAPEDVQTQIDTHTTEIKQNADNIALKVSQNDYNGNYIASLINQSATTVAIDASKINLNGYVTMTNLMTPGQTTIDGGNVDSTNLHVKAANIDGAVNATNLLVRETSGVTIYAHNMEFSTSNISGYQGYSTTSRPTPTQATSGTALTPTDISKISASGDSNILGVVPSGSTYCYAFIKYNLLAEYQRQYGVLGGTTTQQVAALRQSIGKIDLKIGASTYYSGEVNVNFSMWNNTEGRYSRGGSWADDGTYKVQTFTFTDDGQSVGYYNSDYIDDDGNINILIYSATSNAYLQIDYVDLTITTLSYTDYGTLLIDATPDVEGGRIYVYDNYGVKNVILGSNKFASSGNQGGTLILNDASGSSKVELSASDGYDSGVINLKDANGVVRVAVYADSNIGPMVAVRNANNETVSYIGQQAGKINNERILVESDMPHQSGNFGAAGSKIYASSSQWFYIEHAVDGSLKIHWDETHYCTIPAGYVQWSNY